MAITIFARDGGGMTETVSSSERKLWLDGPNLASDAVIIRESNVCLIEREDGGGSALPGGFRNPGESGLEAAIREANEEVGLTLEDGQLVFSGKVDDPRNSPTSWIESDAYLFMTTSETNAIAGDDAKALGWHPLDSLPDRLYGSHRQMIENAKDVLALNLLLSQCDELPVNGGHMAYDYRLYNHPSGAIFVKRHTPSNFTNPEREEHSRYYLSKESIVINHLRDGGYAHVPGDQLLVGDSVLVMEGLAPKKGWHWQIPDGAEREAYIQQTLTAFEGLEHVPKLELEEPILPSIVSFYEEGWGAYTSESRQKIINRLREFTPRLHPSTARSIGNLINDLDALASALPPKSLTTFSHHDARQNNIAWHPDHGVRIVDWSWYGPGTPKADTTSFLIDVAKSGIDITPYLARYFDAEHAKLLIGFWLHHSLWPTRTADNSVRLHQIASALTAYQLVSHADLVCAERSLGT